MRTARLLTFLIAAVFLQPLLASAQESLPENLAGFIKEGMHVGLKSYENNPNMDLTIFTEAHYKTLIDAQSMPLEELMAKNPKVAQGAKDALKRFQESPPQRLTKSPANRTYTEPQVQVRIPRLFYATIIHVGGDYILLQHDQGNEKDLKQAISIDRISRIRWDSGELNFNVIATAVQN